MADYNLLLGEAAPSDIILRRMQQPTACRFVWKVDGPCTAQFELDGRSVDAATIITLETDLHIFRNGQALGRYRVTTEADDITETEHRTQFSATDYRGMLSHRIVGRDGAEFVDTDSEDIVWSLIQATQATSGGNFGITNAFEGFTGSGINRTVKFDAGKKVSEAIDDLAHLENGFEWDVDYLLRLHAKYPVMNHYHDTKLDFGGNVSKVERLLSTTDFANAVMVSATSEPGVPPVSQRVTGLCDDHRGRWETFVSYTDGTNEDTVGARVQWLLDQTSVLTPEIVVTIAPNRWTPSNMWIGDVVTLAVRSGRINEVGTFRIVEVNVAVNEDDETVKLGLLPFVSLQS